MKKNLEMADTIVKLVLSVSTIVLFLAGAIAGPLAQWLLVLSLAVVLLYAVKQASVRFKKKDSGANRYF